MAFGPGGGAGAGRSDGRFHEAAARLPSRPGAGHLPRGLLAISTPSAGFDVDQAAPGRPLTQRARMAMIDVSARAPPRRAEALPSDRRATGMGANSWRRELMAAPAPRLPAAGRSRTALTGAECRQLANAGGVTSGGRTEVSALASGCDQCSCRYASGRRFLGRLVPEPASCVRGNHQGSRHCCGEGSCRGLARQLRRTRCAA